MNPTIGVPMLGKDLPSRYMQQKYSACLRRAGAFVQVLRPEAASEELAAAISRCRGFLFPDGPDIGPGLDGQAQEPEAEAGAADGGQALARDSVALARDSFELSLLGVALADRKPLFCINRGMLLLNVAFGGSLYQDIKLRQQYQHFDFWHRAAATHPVEVDGDSILARLFSTDILTVNSIHRQAVDNLGQGLWIAAGSPDGFPEALEIEGYPFCLAVQWNPEYMVRRTPLQGRLFREFVEECKK